MSKRSAILANHYGTSNSTAADKSAKPDVRAQFADYYVWQEPDRDKIICLNPQTVERLQLDVLGNTWSSGRERAETGGILLGRMEVRGTHRLIVVEDFCAVPCEHRHGPTYSLSRKDIARFETAVERCSAPGQPLLIVGCYRSHNRPGLYLSAEDMNLARAYFSAEHSLFLLIKTLPSGACTAAFFFRQNGNLEPDLPYLEAPLGPVESLALVPFGFAGVPATHVPQGMSWQTDSAANHALQSQRKVNTTLGGRQLRFRRISVDIGLASALLAAVLFVPRRPATKRADIGPSTALDLSAVRMGDHLTLRWNAACAQIMGAQRGVLSIRDGNNERAIVLDPHQLQAGAIAYAEPSDNTDFRLETYRDGKRTSSQSLQVMVLKSSPSVVQERTAANAVPKPPVANSQTPAKGTIETRSNAPRVFTVPTSMTPARIPSSASVTELEPATVPVGQKSLDSLAQPREPLGLLVHTSMADLITRAVAIPPVKTTDGHTVQDAPKLPADSLKATAPSPSRPNPPGQPGLVPSYVGPQIVYRASPVIPSSLRPLLKTAVDIDVTVTIDTKGTIQEARVTRMKGIGAGFITEQALRAAREFQFMPARLNNVPVQSSLVLTFRFTAPWQR